MLVISSYLYGIVALRVGERDFALPKDKEVSIVQIIPFEGEKITLEKDIFGEWRVDSEHRANEFAVKDLIRTIRHFAIRQPVSVAKQDQVNKQLDNEGVFVNVYIKGYVFDFFNLFGILSTQRLYNSFFVGDDISELEGTYMRMTGSDNPYIVYLPGYQGGLSEVFTPDKHIWFDPVVVDLKPDQIKKVKVINNEEPKQSFILKVNSGFDFDFYDIEGNLLKNDFKPDTTRVMRFLSSFKQLYYEKLLVDEAYEESENLIFPQKSYRIVVEDRDDNTKSFDVYRRYLRADILDPGAVSPVYDPDRFYLELEQGHRALAQYFVFGRILRPLSFFMMD